jgi:hypothetical protein
MPAIKTIIGSACGVAVALALAPTIQAQGQLNGSMEIQSYPVDVDYGDQAGVATEVTSWLSPDVVGTTGSFSSLLVGDSPSLPAPWDFDSGAIPDFVSVGDFTFDLIQSSATSQFGVLNGWVYVSGTGVINETGYAATPATLSFTATTDGIMTFGQLLITAEPTPEPGSATLLGLGAVLGVVFWRGRSLRRAK